MKHRHLLLLPLLIATVALSGCGLWNKIFNRGDNLQAPKPLVEITPSVQVQKLWSSRVGDGSGRSGVRLQPTYADGKLYLISTDGKIEALDAATGKTLWKQSTRVGDGIWPFKHKKPGPDARYAGGPGVLGNLLVVGTLDGHVYAMDSATGKPIWSAEVDNEVISPPAIDAGNVYVRTNSGYVYAFDANSGERKWVYDQANVPLLSLRGNGPLLAAHGVVMFGSDDGNVVSLRGDTGAIQWKLPITKGLGRTDIQKLNDADDTLQLDGSTLYATAYHGELTAIDATQGQLLWNRAFSSYVGVGVTDKALVGVDDDSLVWAFSKDGGGDLWKQDALQYHWLTAPAIQGNYAVVGGVEGYVQWLDLADGKIAARMRLSKDEIRARPVVNGDTVYVEDVKGHVAAYRIGG
ncbi:MAG: outer membrane protein assembly factor BamB [Xanthomonadales bacterium]|nr:outer membrane protein assembly factor BamB [Xanthomonadales bacterium]ODU74358.1 MAG: outer membrane protein assembly factor BamB [Rhodanobacter sp. SCN 69-32]OJY84154.1 MAG: outer membrane protein assembly factor BamB [Xanthomonadales bacterium 66-474]